VGAVFLPDKKDPSLVIDPNAVLPITFSLQYLQLIARRDT
jgi:hypothetical protein